MISLIHHHQLHHQRVLKLEELVQLEELGQLEEFALMAQKSLAVRALLRNLAVRALRKCGIKGSSDGRTINMGRTVGL